MLGAQQEQLFGQFKAIDDHKDQLMVDDKTVYMEFNEHQQQLLKEMCNLD